MRAHIFTDPTVLGAGEGPSPCACLPGAGQAKGLPPSPGPLGALHCQRTPCAAFGGPGLAQQLREAADDWRLALNLGDVPLHAMADLALRL
eukprot:8627220-Lingulodinium_polyedra.AAC.1